MNLVLLSRAPSLYSTRRLGLVAISRGHDVRVVNPLRAALVVRANRGGEGSVLAVDGVAVAPADAVLVRTGRRGSGHTLAVARHLELAGSYCVNAGGPIARARDKLFALQLLAAAGVPVVPSAVARRPADVRRVVEAFGGPPCVVKLAEGTQGTGVVLVESIASAESVVEALAGINRHLLVQPYVPHERDLRLIVVGRKVVAAMQRRPREGNFRANIHQGGTGTAHAPSEFEARIALDATGALGLSFAGVDLLETPDGPVVLEVNASPGLEGVERASGRNVALAVVRMLEAHVRQPAPV